VELGYRVLLTNKVQLDLEAAYSASRDYSTIAYKDMFYGFNNMPLRAYQGIFTFTINYSPSSHFNLKLFGSVQTTELKDVTLNLMNLDERVDMHHENTPTVYGGMIINVVPVSKLNINANAYYYSGQTNTRMTTSDNVTGEVYFNGYTDVSGKILFNVKALYQIAKSLSIYINVRNLLNSSDPEFGLTDGIKATYLAGLSFEMN